MKIRLGVSLILVFFILAIDLDLCHAQTPDAWWDDNWPYRVPITLNSDVGTARLNLDFTELFTHLGLNDSLLDLRSVRVVPYQDNIPGTPLPYEETYSKLIIDADTLNLNSGGSLPYWFGEEDTMLTPDTARYTQGTGAIRADTIIKDTSSHKTGFSYHFQDASDSDWTGYETLLYDVWPEVNESAIDQTPDLFFFELEGLTNCPSDEINGPPLIMDQWNPVSVSLRPYGNCQSPVSSSLNAIRFFVKVNYMFDNDHGYFDPGDEIKFWVDNFRLVDQNGSGEIRWAIQPGVERYYLYFDTLNHTGHPPPNLITTGVPTTTAHHGDPEAGGYFHQISGASADTLLIWNAPITEKILPSQTIPQHSKPLIIAAARNEFEPFQLVVRSPTTQSLPVSISDLIHSNSYSKVPASQAQLFRVDYLEITQLTDFYGRVGASPDPLYPVTLGKKIKFPANKNQPLWFRIKVPANATAGIYTGEITIGNAKIPFSLQVWGMTLPSISPLSTYFGFDWETVLETYGGIVDGVPHRCQEKLINAILTTFNDYRITPSMPGDSGFPETISRYSLLSYEIQKAHALQLHASTPVWWEFTPEDLPPLANPAVIDRPGLDARILPWLVWLDRVDGLYYPQTTDWDADPWHSPFSNGLGNGDGVLFYPPKDDTIGHDPCKDESNRLIPSIRLELLREGLEDYAYLWLLNNGKPIINKNNQGDHFSRTFIGSRTAFDRLPATLAQVRNEIAAQLHRSQVPVFVPLLFR